MTTAEDDGSSGVGGGGNVPKEPGDTGFRLHVNGKPVDRLGKKVKLGDKMPAGDIERLILDRRGR